VSSATYIGREGGWPVRLRTVTYTAGGGGRLGRVAEAPRQLDLPDPGSRPILSQLGTLSLTACRPIRVAGIPGILPPGRPVVRIVRPAAGGLIVTGGAA
jgi:hypothetical protein